MSATFGQYKVAGAGRVVKIRGTCGSLARCAALCHFGAALAVARYSSVSSPATGTKLRRECEIKRLYYVQIDMEAACDGPWTSELDFGKTCGLRAGTKGNAQKVKLQHTSAVPE